MCANFAMPESVKDSIYKVLTDLGLEDVPPDRIKKVLSDARSELLASADPDESSEALKS